MSRQSQVARSHGTAVLAQPRSSEEIAFSLSGPLTPTTSPPWVPRSNAALVEVVALLGTAGSGPTSIAINKNGVLVHTITIGGGLTRQVDSGLNIPYLDTADVLTDTVIAIGNGAADLTILHRF